MIFVYICSIIADIAFAVTRIAVVLATYYAAATTATPVSSTALPP